METNLCRLPLAREQACGYSTIVYRVAFLTENLEDLLLSAAPVESHVGAIVVRSSSDTFTWRKVLTFDRQDSPNACVTLAIPTGIFEHVSFTIDDLVSVWSQVGQDILPNPDGFSKRDFGQCAIRSDGVV